MISLSSQFDRPDSFSFVALEGNVSHLIEDFLMLADYQILRKGSFSGSFPELYQSIRDVNGSVVEKAWYQAEGKTFLLDPEMVLSTNDEWCASIAERLQSNVIAALWERVSQTAMLREVSRDGIVRESYYTAGKEGEDQQKDPYEEMQAHPDSTGLLAALALYGITNTAFETVEALVVKLQG